MNFVAAQGLPEAVPPHAEHVERTERAEHAERSLDDWLQRMHEASRRLNYEGTFVVSAAASGMASARIWHVCEGSQQIERVEALTGTPRATFRRGNEVITFLPEVRLARTERRDTLGMFPDRLKAGNAGVAAFYSVRRLPDERVAGFVANVLLLAPRDALRYGYRVWSEKRSGLVIQLQTLDEAGRVLEQSAFSELRLNAPIKAERLVRMMANTSGYQVQRLTFDETTAAAEGWRLRQPVAGFEPTHCLRRQISAADGAQHPGALQWVFSDGLATVSLFVEPYARRRRAAPGLAAALGATQTLTRRLGGPDAPQGGWWLTAVGEVPPRTLEAFAQGLEREPPEVKP